VHSAMSVPARASLFARVRALAAYVISSGDKRRYRMSPDGWMSPRATRHRAVRPWPDGKQNCTSPHDGGSSALHSVTPTAVTAFLLYLWLHQGAPVAWLDRRRCRQRSYEHSTPESSWPGVCWWVTARLDWGLSYTASPTRWGLTRQAIPASLTLEPPSVHHLRARSTAVQYQAESTLTRRFSQDHA
jgi:hypothetical protein